MSTLGVGSVTTSQASDSLTAGLSQAELGQDAFLQLLITQLRYQDPTDPLQDREFVAQLAQFTALEQAQQTNDMLMLLAQLTSATQAISLVGRTVEYVGESGEVETGEVSGITFDQGTPYLLIGEEEISPATVTRVL